MNFQRILTAVLLLATFALVSCNDDSTTPSSNNAPEISSLAADPVTVGIGEACQVTCLASDNDGDDLTYTWNSTSGTVTGSGATITWTAPDAVTQSTVSCSVSDGENSVSDSVVISVFEPVVPGTMVAVTGGTFAMGDAYDEGAAVERPVHSVSVSDFLIGKYELTQGEWAAYMAPPAYDIGSGAAYPVYSVSWFDIILYCNLRSIDEGLSPCYNISGSTLPSDWPVVPNYSSDGSFAAWNAVECNVAADGYRLPTEAEWEYAARGGASHTDNFRYSGSQTVGDVAWDGTNAPVGCQAVGGLMPNQLGLYDMSGNLYELCWDWHGDDYYSTCLGQGLVTNPTGPASSDMRIVRGGGWGGDAANCRVAGRYRDYPVSRFNHTGVRLVRRP